ncbi:MAG: hypothetical protein J7L54_00660, partial [Elusimicrobia bacterium]|nr:hypothetical protein [Elusimicrobiota bacterium]
MKKALVLTVGGSDKPLVISIKTWKPDFICFVCSDRTQKMIDGEGKVCCDRYGKPVRQSIKNQSNYSGDYEKIIVNPDDFNEIYRKILEKIRQLKKENFEILADFTGGSKTMSSVLEFFALMDFGIKPVMVKGPRRDIMKTTSGSVAVPVDVDSARADIIFKFADALIKSHLYTSARKILDELATKIADTSVQRAIIRKSEICEGFELWDKFEYE